MTFKVMDENGKENGKTHLAYDGEGKQEVGTLVGCRWDS